LAETMDRLPALRADGLNPWITKIAHQCPAPPTP
jgi:hypothetical protein